MAGRDIGAALFLFVGAVLLIAIVIPAETIPGDEGELSQAFMPTLAAAAILLAAALVLVRAVYVHLRARRALPGQDAGEGPAAEVAEPERQPIDRVFWVVLAGAALLLGAVLGLILHFGFLVGSGAAILVFGLVFNRRAWVGIAALATLLPAAAYYLVLHGLGLALP